MAVAADGVRLASAGHSTAVAAVVELSIVKL